MKVIEAEEVHAKTGYAAPHTVHCGPDGIYMNALGAPDGGGPGGIFMLDHETFDVMGAWENDRGPQHLAYDFWWHLGHDTMITSEWGTPNMVTKGLDPELLLAGKYGHPLHVWDLRTRTHLQTLDLGAEHQMVLELRPAHDPTEAYGFVGVVISLEDLSSSIWIWYRQEGSNGSEQWAARKVITFPPSPPTPTTCRRCSRASAPCRRWSPTSTSRVDDQFLYVSCWGTGELLQYDVSDPFHPRQTGSVQLGGIVRRAAHPAAPDRPLNGGPQMVEVSRDGRRVYFTNSLYSPWDEQFYPDGVRGWMAKVDVDPAGGMALDPRFLVEVEDGLRAHQVRLQGGDASSDSFCYS